MRIKTIVVGLAVALCAMGVLSAQAFAKEKKVFGEWQASVAGHNLETEPAALKVNREDTPSLTGLQLGNYEFGKVDRETGKQNDEEPCRKLGLTGLVNHEKSSSLTANLKFSHCSNVISSGGVSEEKTVTFTLAVKFDSNFSSEVGKSESSMEIEPGTVSIKAGLKKCTVLIPRQTIPFKANSEKEYEEIVSYSDESEPIENWAKSTKLQERYPSGNKERVEIELGEKFKGIHSYVKDEPPCSSNRGEESGKLVEQEGSPYNGMLEFTNGHIFADIEGVEIKNGELKFVEPA